MSASDLLTPFDFGKLLWQPTDGVAEGRKRPLSGGEQVQDALNRFCKGDQALYFGVYVDVAESIPESRLISAAKDAWSWLRFQIPTIASRIEIDNTDRPWLVYTSGSAESIKQWVERTVIVHKQDVIDLDAIRHEVEGKKIPDDNGDQTWIHIVPGATSFGILFRSHHAPFDGSALRIIFDQYLAKLAKDFLGSKPTTDTKISWGNEFQNLVPAVFNILSPAEPRPVGLAEEGTISFSHPYYATLGRRLQGFAESMHDPYTFKPRPVSDNWPAVRRASLHFSQEESGDILKHLKHSAGGRYTLTQLAHAALAMTVISDNPPSSNAASQKIHNLSLANCRSSLAEPYNSPSGYPGYALGVYPIHVPVSLFLQEGGRLHELNKDTLARVMKHLREAYEAQKKYPAAISTMAQGSELFSSSIKQRAATNQLLRNQGYAFSSDGQGETYLRGAYLDGSGKTLLTVRKFFTAVNRTDPGPFFRVWSWKGIIELSVDYNSNSVSLEEAEGHLDTWKKSMLLIRGFVENDY